MKKILLLLLVLVSSVTYAQNNGITYQAVIYSTTGESVPGIKNSNSPLSNKAICIQFSIVDENTQTEYQEKVTVTTDDFGMVNLVIGNGTQTGGYANSFNAIVWSNPDKYLKVSVDQSGNCSSFELISNQILTYVPFALAANSATSVSGIVGIANGGTNAATVLGAKTNLQLQNVDNTSDLNKPLSTATQTALNTKVDKVNGKDLSTNDFTTAEKIKLAGISGTNPIVQDLSAYATNTDLALKAPLASPTLTGTPTAPTATSGTNTTQLATTAFVSDAVTGKFVDLTTAQTIAGNKTLSNNLAVNGNISTTGQITSTGAITTGNITYPITAGTNGQILTSSGNGTSTWTNPASISIGTIASNSNANGGTIASGVLNLTPADVTNGGIVTNGAQAFAGNKTLSGTLGIGTNATDASAALEVKSTTQGFLPPRLTTAQRDAISNPASGLIIYNASNKSLENYVSITSTITEANATDRGGWYAPVSPSRTDFMGTRPSYSAAQSFVPTTSNSLTDIEIYAVNVITAGIVDLKIFDGSGTSGNLLSSQSISVSSSGVYKVSLTSALSVSQGHTYTFEFSPVNGNFNIGLNDNYANGNFFQNGSGSSNDLRFNLYYSSSTGSWKSQLTTDSILPIANGGTGSSTQNYADLTTAQTIAGAKTFSSNITAAGFKTASGTSSQYLMADGSVSSSSSGSSSQWTTSNDDIYFSTGKVGIGLSNPGSVFNTNLDVAGRSSFRINSSTKALIMDGSSGFSRIYTDAASGTPDNLILGTYPNGHMKQLFLKQSNGYVGINNDNPSEQLDVTGLVKATGFKTPSGTSSQYLMADGSVSSVSSVSSGPQILTKAQRDALNLTSSGVMIFNTTTNQYQGSVYYTTGYNYNYFTNNIYGISEIKPGHSITQTFTGKGQVITSADIAVVNMNRPGISNTGNFTFEIWDETYQYPLFSTTITLNGAGTVSVTIPNNSWYNLPTTLPNGPCSFRITSDSVTGGSADFLMNAGPSVGSLSNTYWASLGGTSNGYTTPTTSHQLAIDLFPQNGLTWVNFN